MTEMAEIDPRAETINAIRRGLPPAALFEQLAEECVELAHCAQKQARLMRGENPTDADLVELVKDTDEELADVFVCLEVLGLNPNANLMDAKKIRWAGRLAAFNNAANQIEDSNESEGEEE